MRQVPKWLRSGGDLDSGLPEETIAALESIALACIDLQHESMTARAAWYRADAVEEATESLEQASATPFRHRAAQKVRARMSALDDVLTELYIDRVGAYTVAVAHVLNALVAGRASDVAVLADLVDREITIAEAYQAVTGLTAAWDDELWAADVKDSMLDPAQAASVIDRLRSFRFYDDRNVCLENPPLRLCDSQMGSGLEQANVLHALAESAHFAIARVADRTRPGSAETR